MFDSIPRVHASVNATRFNTPKVKCVTAKGEAAWRSPFVSLSLSVSLSPSVSLSLSLALSLCLSLARTSAVDDGLCPGFEGRDTSASPSSYLLIVHYDDDEVTSLVSLQNNALNGSGDGEDCDGVERGITHDRLHDDAHSDHIG